MDYGKIIARAWEITKKYRSLWWLGLLAGFAEEFGGGVPSGSGWKTGSSPEIENFQGTEAVSGVADRLPQVLGTATSSATDSTTQIINWIGNYPYLFVLIILISILLYVLLSYIGNAARAGHYLSVEEIEAKSKELGFGKAFNLGQKFAWRLFGQSWFGALVIIAVLIGLAVIVAIPILLGGQDSTPAIAITISLGIIALLAFIAFAIAFGIILRFAARAMVLRNLGIIESINFGKNILQKRLSNTLLVWLIEVGLSIAIMIGLFITILLVILLLGGVAVGLWFLNKIVFGAYVGIAVLALFVGFATLSGILNSFMSSYWTLSFRALEHLSQKNNK